MKGKIERKKREGESWKQVDRERKRERREKKIYKERQGGGGGNRWWVCERDREGERGDRERIEREREGERKRKTERHTDIHRQR